MKDLEISMVKRPWDPSLPIPDWLDAWAKAATDKKLAVGDPEHPPCRVIVGQTGSGKTMAAAKLAASYLEAGGCRVGWCVTRSTEQKIMEALRIGEGTRLEADFDRAGLLVIDDLAWQLFGLAPKARERETERETYRRRLAVWFTAIDERLRASLPTVVTSNLHPSDWGDPALASRLSTAWIVRGRQQEDYRVQVRPAGKAKRVPL